MQGADEVRAQWVLPALSQCAARWPATGTWTCNPSVVASEVAVQAAEGYR